MADQKDEDYGLRAMTRLLRNIDLNISRLERYARPKGVPVAIKLYTIINGQKKELRMQPLKQGQQGVIECEIVDAAGNAAKIQDDKLDFSVKDASMGEIKGEGLKAVFTPAAGFVGLATVFAKGDADLGDGVVELVGEGEFDCLSGQAVLIKLKLSAQDPVAPAAKK